MKLPPTTPKLPVFRPDIQSITVGLFVMIGIIVTTIWAFGFIKSVPILFISGIVAGAITGWLTVKGIRVAKLSDAMLVGVIHAIISAGVGGAIIYLYTLLGPAGVTRDLVNSVWGGAGLLLIASPLAVVFFGVEGSIGGAIGALLQVRITES